MNEDPVGQALLKLATRPSPAQALRGDLATLAMAIMVLSGKKLSARLGREVERIANGTPPGAV